MLRGLRSSFRESMICSGVRVFTNSYGSAVMPRPPRTQRRPSGVGSNGRDACTYELSRLHVIGRCDSIRPIVIGVRGSCGLRMIGSHFQGEGGGEEGYEESELEGGGEGA